MRRDSIILKYRLWSSIPLKQLIFHIEPIKIVKIITNKQIQHIKKTIIITNPAKRSKFIKMETKFIRVTIKIQKPTIEQSKT